MDISIIIVTWNNERQIATCLRSLYGALAGFKAEVFVIDNASTDGTRKIVEELRTTDYVLRTIFNTNNLGFAAAVNQGMRLATGAVVLLLNPDTIAKNDSIRPMLDYLAAHPEVGVAGGTIWNTDGTLQPSVRRFPTGLSQAAILSKLYRFFPALVAGYFHDGFDFGIDQAVDQVRGAFFFITRPLIDRIGLMDEKNFFLWFEEVDYCKRAHDAGFEVRYVPLASVIHEGGTSFAQEISVTKQRYLNRSMRNYFRKHGQAGALCLVTVLHPVSMLLAHLVQAARVKPKSYV